MLHSGAGVFEIFEMPCNMYSVSCLYSAGWRFFFYFDDDWLQVNKHLSGGIVLLLNPIRQYFGTWRHTFRNTVLDDSTWYLAPLLDKYTTCIVIIDDTPAEGRRDITERVCTTAHCRVTTTLYARDVPRARSVDGSRYVHIHGLFKSCTDLCTPLVDSSTSSQKILLS
jgi:hypothetical protein